MTERYSKIAMLLHWTIALLIIVGFVMGSQMTDIPISPLRVRVYNYHKWIGITVLVLVFVRLAWRSTHRPPAMLPMPAWQKIAAEAAHIALYFLMFLVPISGWMYSSAAGITVHWFGVIALPDLVSADKNIAISLRDAHEFLTAAMLVVFVAHLAGALKHHFIDKDDTLRRMMPGRR